MDTLIDQDGRVNVSIISVHHTRCSLAVGYGTDYTEIPITLFIRDMELFMAWNL